MVFPEQQVEDKPSGAHSGTALGMTAGSLLPPGVPSRRALCSPRSLSPPPPSAPHAPPPAPRPVWAAVSEAGGCGSIPVVFKANSPVLPGKPDALPSSV